MAKFRPETKMQAFGLGCALTAVTTAGIYINMSNSPNDYNDKLVESADKIAVGQPFPGKEFDVESGGKPSRQLVSLVINNMLATAGERPVTNKKGAEQPDPKVRAAVACGLLALNTGKVSVSAQKDWGAAQHAASVENTNPASITALLTEAAVTCESDLNTAIDKGNVQTLLVPVTLQ